MTAVKPYSDGLRERLSRVRVLAMDVDGVLTDGTLQIGNDGCECKQFHVADGLGIVIASMLGVQVIWVSGRESVAVQTRAAELGITRLLQGVRDKGAALSQFCREQDIPMEQLAFIGDDWNDLPAFQVAGVKIAVANARAEVRAAADLITEHAGGHGAVREVCEAIMDARGERSRCLERYLEGLRSAG
ncbi:MAG: HAD hydrolase family protein [Chloroherpetonaceae bacterium]|nr:HAD hydrolase family protein [Chthonomonadaceae bacterium]MDW8208263.1 HAD hydrolase family protein [Chloroherpetonaceae bacterium]